MINGMNKRYKGSAGKKAETKADEAKKEEKK